MSQRPSNPDASSADDGNSPFGSLGAGLGMFQSWMKAASSTGERLDGSFSACERFLIYQISPAASRLVDIRTPRQASDDEDRNALRAELLEDCQLLYTLSIGGPATAKVIRAGVHPIKINEAMPARDVVSELQRVLASSPPPWLAKAMGADPGERIRFSGNSSE